MDGRGAVTPHQQEQVKPLCVRPLSSSNDEQLNGLNCDKTSEINKDGHYRVIQRIVSSSPNPAVVDGEIQTTLEAYVSSHGDTLWRRVAISSIDARKDTKNGGSSGLHMSFMLPKQDVATDSFLENIGDDPSKSLFCWAAFSDRPTHKYLCVLVQPSLLGIWDVYPTESLPGNQQKKNRKNWAVGEGYSMALPFECWSIFSIGDVTGGILLQRKEMKEDKVDNVLANSWLASHEEEDCAFVLRDPPKPVRLGKLDSSPASAVHTHHLPTPQAEKAHSVPRISSLFSLTHPLDDVLPINLIANSETNESEPFADVFEKVLFVDVLRWTDHHDDYCDKKERFQTICVTYHKQLQRHAIWAVENAPPPPPAPPLWEQTRQWRCDEDWTSTYPAIDNEVMEMEMMLLGVADTNNDNAAMTSMSRDDALADALGVRRTPRKSTQEVGLPPRTRSTAAVRKSRRQSGGNASFELTPTAANNNTASTRETDQMEVDMMNGNLPDDCTGPPTLLSFVALSDLHPRLALKCLFKEVPRSEEASNVFLASQLDGSGLLLICLCCPVHNAENPLELKLLSVKTNRERTLSSEGNMNRCMSIEQLTTISCVSAQPIQATPIPHCFRPHIRHRNKNYDWKATDILVLTKTNALVLYRSSFSIVECILSDSDGKSLPIVEILNPVQDRCDFLHYDNLHKLVATRCTTSLRLAASAFAETVLEVVDSALFLLAVELGDSRGLEAALMLRADCARLARLICDSSHLLPGLCMNPNWSAVETALSSIFKQEFVATDTQRAKRLLAKDHSSDWYTLVRSQYHKQYVLNDFDGLLGNFNDPEASKHDEAEDDLNYFESDLQSIGPLAPAKFASMDQAFTTSVFDSIHLFYEDCKLLNSIKKSGWLQAVGSFLYRLCSAASTEAEATGRDVSLLKDFIDYYSVDLCSLGPRNGEVLYQRQLRPLPQRVGRTLQITSFRRPPNFFAWVDNCLKRVYHADFYGECVASNINAACHISRAMHRILTSYFSDLNGCDQDFHTVERTRNQLVITQMTEEGLTDPVWVRDELPAGVSIPLLELLYQCRCDAEWACASLSSTAWLLIGRPDLCANREIKFASELALPGYHNHLGTNKDGDEELSFEDKDNDGIVPIELSSSALFPGDNRVREVGRLLRTSRPVFLSVERAVEVSDHDFERLKQRKLLLLCQRVLAQPVGRGMFTLGNLRLVPAEPLPVPTLCLTGRLPPTNATLALDLTEAPADMKHWPDFSNGVASGLRLPLNRTNSDAAGSITRSWIVYNKTSSANQPQAQGDISTPNQQASPSNLGHSHGGLLMALGLRGHLSTLNVADVYEYLAHGTMTTTVGVLLGLSANKRGSCDISISKMLCLHIPTLIPQHFSSSIDVASPVQAAAVAGAGLLFQGSSHRMMTEFFLNELGRRPESDMNVDRDAYTLSCGLALGMINLCQGQSIADGGKAGLADLRIEERLHRYVVGGVDDDDVRKRRETSDRFTVPSLATGDNDKCSRIYEGDTINTDVSAPGATLALGLMYMKSGNKTMAACLALPGTHFLLEYVRPDFLMLRVIARSLILWDDVLPTRKWIHEQIPRVVAISYNVMREAVKKATNLSDISLRSEERVGNAPSSRCADIDDLSPDENASSSTTDFSGRATRIVQNFDRQAVRQIYTHVIAGACFGIGLRFAGTGDKQAVAAILKCLLELYSLRDENDPVSMALRPERPVLEMCLGCVAISLALVLAGSGDLPTLRLFKVLRWRCDDKVNYGTHMAFSCAIGLLFLGGGTCTIGREPEDIAALVMAFFPRFPSTSSDNLFHLQALRHMYVLAVKERELRAIDIDTQETVSVAMEIHFENENVQPLRMHSPCLLMNTDEVPKEIRIISDHYYPVRIVLEKPVTGRTFFVKKRSCFLTNSHGPPLHRLLRRRTENLAQDSFLSSIHLTSDDPRVIAFANHVALGWTTTGGPLSFFEYCTQALEECLTMNTEQALPIYLSLRSAVFAVENEVPSSSILWDIRLIRTYYEERHHFVSEECQAIIHPRLVAALIDKLERKLFSHYQAIDVEAHMQASGESGISDVDKRLESMLTYFGASFPFLDNDSTMAEQPMDSR